MTQKVATIGVALGVVVDLCKCPKRVRVTCLGVQMDLSLAQAEALSDLLSEALAQSSELLGDCK
jgi:hypothetical protein